MIDSVLPLGNDFSAMNTLPTMNAMSALTSRMSTMANVEAAAQEFEAMFASQLLEPMFSTVSVNDSFGGGHGEEAMRSFLVQEYGKFIAKTGMLGIASQVKSVMLRAQEASDARSGTSARSKQRAASDSFSGPKGLDRVASK